MTFQSTVNYDYGFGIPGEIVREGPLRAHPGIISSASAANNVFGRAFTQAAAGGKVAAGGTGIFFGLLANPKQHASFGGTLGPLSPTFALPNETIADFVTMGLICVQLATAAQIGNQVTYDTTTGALDSVAVTASFTASQATTVLTVSAITAGTIGVGTIVRDATGNVIGTVISLGTGTGGVGTYNLNTSATVASGAMTGNSVATAGKAFVPNAFVRDYPQPNTNGLALIRITN